MNHVSSATAFHACLLKANLCRARLQPCREARRIVTEPQAAEKVVHFVIPSEARNLSSICTDEKKERFLASLGMTKRVEPFSAACLAAGLTGGAR